MIKSSNEEKWFHIVWYDWRRVFLQNAWSCKNLLYMQTDQVQDFDDNSNDDNDKDIIINNADNDR